MEFQPGWFDPYTVRLTVRCGWGQTKKQKRVLSAAERVSEMPGQADPPLHVTSRPPQMWFSVALMGADAF